MSLHHHSFKTLLKVTAITVALAACGGTGKVQPETEEPPARASEEQVRMETDFMIGKAAYTTGDLQRAEAIFYAMSRAYPELAAPQINLTMVYARQGDVKKAERAFRKALSLKSDISELYNHMGIMYREKGEFAKAILQYKKGLEIDPNHTSLLANIGILYDLYMDQPQEALKYYQRYQALVPDDNQVKSWIAALKQRTVK